MMVSVAQIRAEYSPAGDWVAVATPRLSWKTETAALNWKQQRAEIEVTRGGPATVHHVDGPDAVLVAWPATPLRPREHIRVRVRVFGVDGSQSTWSEPVEIRGGFLAEGEWTAPMIGARSTAQKQPALLRKDIDVRAGLQRATLYATAQGVYQAWVNGQPIDDHEFKPGWTSYEWRLTHETSDVTGLLREGSNTVGFELAGGWFTETFVNDDPAHGHYGDQPSVAAQIHLEYIDGSAETVTTDTTWQSSVAGPIVASGIYAGEHVDARLTMPGWAEPGFVGEGWTHALMRVAPFPVPEARTAPPVRATQTLPVQRVVSNDEGRIILDFGQNLVGRLRLRVRGERGTRITLRHAEVLENGELGIRPLRGAAATDSFTLAGAKITEEWEPRFTFHGFRYAELTGWPGSFDPTDVDAVVIHSDLERTGWFTSSHALVNQLHENAVWGMRGNFLSIPTDCPQRDERLGWTGDILAFAPAASYLFQSNGFLASWLRDLWHEQAHNGGIPPFVIPSVLEEDPAAAWGDAVTFVPATLRERFDDLAVIADGYDGMTAWCDRVLALAGPRHLWEDGFQFGDWLDPDAPPALPAKAKTDPDIVATAFLQRSLSLTAAAAHILGHVDDALYYSVEAAAVRTAFLAEYATSGGRLVSDSQTAYALAIVFDLASDDAQRQAFGDRLAYLTRAGGYRIGTGFVGTPIIQDALSATGHADVAERLLLQTENPSWLYPVTQGATTIWERWDSLLPDGTINPGEMTSFNHYALGSVVDWLHRRVAGVAPAAPGYRSIEVRPTILRGFTHATATLETPYGRTEAGWERIGGSVRVHVTVPPNADATVHLPDGAEHRVGSGQHEWIVDAPLPAARHGFLGLDGSLAALIDDQDVFRHVARTVEVHSPTLGEEFRIHTRWTPGRRIRDAFRYAPPALVADVEKSLAEAQADEATA